MVINGVLHRVRAGECRGGICRSGSGRGRRSTSVIGAGRTAHAGRLFAEGTLQVGVDSTYPLSEATGAHARAAQGHIQGKSKLTVVP
ncbi:zinc-binding dehydrogenase [Streptomyces sp. NBC_01428]|uniref:zinc-binding dehydrogenase n=1 Tax=Streptomyces sp. NBC_01428 TaxID=2903861 RepID=UPI003FCD3393